MNRNWWNWKTEKEKTNKIQSRLFAKINIIHKHIARLIKIKKERPQIINFRKERGNNTRDATDIKE